MFSPSETFRFRLLVKTTSLRGNVHRILRAQHPCTVVRVETQYNESAVDFYSLAPTEEFKCALHPDDRKMAGRHFVDIQGVDTKQFYNITSGETTIEVDGAIISNGAYTVPSGASINFGRKETRRRLDKSNGQKKVLVVRANTAGGNTVSQRDDIVDAIFGTYGNTISMRSQYLGCSHGKLDTVPFEGSTTTGYEVTNGIIEVSISEDYTGRTRYDAEEGLYNAAENLVGDLESQFDHVILCLPPGTSDGWVAYAYGKLRQVIKTVNCWLLRVLWNLTCFIPVNELIAAFNDQWCEKLSTLVHGTSFISDS